MCKIIHPSKLSDESYKVFRELLPIMYREVKGRVVFLQKKERGEINARLVPAVLITDRVKNTDILTEDYLNKVYTLPLDNGKVYKLDEEIIVWVLRECLAI